MMAHTAGPPWRTECCRSGGRQVTRLLRSNMQVRATWRHHRRSDTAKPLSPARTSTARAAGAQAEGCRRHSTAAGQRASCWDTRAQRAQRRRAAKGAATYKINAIYQDCATTQSSWYCCARHGKISILPGSGVAPLYDYSRRSASPDNDRCCCVGLRGSRSPDTASYVLSVSVGLRLRSACWRRHPRSEAAVVPDHARLSRPCRRSIVVDPRAGRYLAGCTGGL